MRDSVGIVSDQTCQGGFQDELAVMVGGLGEGALGTVLAILERHHPELYNSDPGDKVGSLAALKKTALSL